MSTNKHVALGQLVDDLLARGVGVSHAGLPDASLLAAAEAEARALHAGGLMYSSTVKNTTLGATHKYKDASSRGDVIRWLDGTDARAPACAALSQWLRGELMDAVRAACASAPPGTNPASGSASQLVIEPHTALPLTMLACYPGGGARFKSHVDNSPEAPDTRCCTAIVYLNGAWTPADGGTLRVYSPATPSTPSTPQLEVEPRRGTLVLFWSHLVPHEVMPAATPRFALSLWMCVDPQRQPPGWLERRS